MVHHRVFLGAPTAADIDKDPKSYVWKAFQEPSSIQPSQSLVLYPPATLNAASRRISLLYQNVIFDDADEEEYHGIDDEVEDSQQQEQTTYVTWPPTAAGNTTGAPSFLRPSQSQPQGTYETQESASFDFSDASSIARFPNFQFSLHKVTSLSSLYTAAKSGKGSRKVNVLLAALEVEGPDTIRIKKGFDAGKDVAILKMILGDEEGSICKLTAWREIAEAWGGFGPAPGLKRGDILYLESTEKLMHVDMADVTASWETGSSITLTASPYNKPNAEICYRTMPYTHEDNLLRPDLRLGQSDAAVRKVAALVRWFENMAGLPCA
ncbi:hypothetical protein HYDPIDRAFT_140324 [Hydnomerulius pinastri MD-312]|uniref:Replication protein A OB domain-containing protein n=1 Tax=Hydnomerulius pinastri MD-312 TaxID=994086 RepID=A0A0C9VPX3_9AGAM|nr:hypothetical protein HYDPIDRAFT_140324 [Hydnomerulius pinastri MD-312]